jgi:hypothetical protein
MSIERELTAAASCPVVDNRGPFTATNDIAK